MSTLTEGNNNNDETQNDEDLMMDDVFEGEDDVDVEDVDAEVAEGSIKLKVRQHVNPLSSKYQAPILLEDNWIENTFPSAGQPILLDIGCAKGTWALKYAKANPQHNILGLEIRRPVVEFALRRKQTWKLSNVHFLAVNANIDTHRILTDLFSRNTQVVMVTIHHPDPHFKTKHKKRRVVNHEFVGQLAALLPIGTPLFVQSDVLDCTEDMVQTILSNPGFTTAPGHDSTKLVENPAPTSIQTEREVATLAKGLVVYRCLFNRV